MAKRQYIYTLPNCQFTPMSKATKNKDSSSSQEITKPLTPEQVKEIVMLSATSSIDVSKNMQELSKELPKWLGKVPPKEVSENVDKVSLALSLETGHILAESVGVRVRGFSLALKKELEKEFDCKTPSEKALVDQAVNSHIRKLEYSKLMNGYREPEWLSHERVALLSFYSKEIDRAHRQFLSAIEILKAIKQPALKVNVRAQNAFVAENQQLNNY